MDFKNDKAIYLQITDYLMDQILQGRYPEGERIASVRECATELEVNVNTCIRAYDWLCQEDIIFTKRGLGYFVSEGAKKAILKEQRKEFFEQTIPSLAQTMQKLGITTSELIERLNKTTL